jgi:long-chain acyl-CoA synthetase
MLLHDILLHAEKTSGTRPAIIDDGLRRTYADVAARVRRAASGLASLGLEPGVRVAIVAPNTADYLEAYFALSLAGLIAVPINTRLSAGEIAFMLDDSGCGAVLVDEAMIDRIGEAATRRVLRLGPKPGSDWNQLIASSEPIDKALSPQDEGSTAHIFYTGGTTGRPKGVMLNHRNVVASAFNKIMLGSFARDDVWLHAAPMFHQADAWAVFSFTALGATHVFLPTFAPGPALSLIGRHRVTGFQLVPTMIFMMLEEAGSAAAKFPHMRRILYGSAPMPTEMLKRARQVFGDVFQHIYGLTEAAGTVAATPWPLAPEEGAGERLGSCGQPIAGVRMRITDGAGAALSTGAIGRIEVKGANVMKGYWNRPEETASALRDDWLDTGDIGHMDADGFVFIVDRAKDMIITGGENVYSTEVEDVLYGHPDIAEAVVVGLPDPRWGEAVTAVVLSRRDAALDEASVIDHCRARLAAYKCPKSVRFVSELPKSAAGKPLKHELRRSLSTGPGN